MSSTTLAILVTGGTGYIGSHACVELLAAGRAIYVVDNFPAAAAALVQGRVEQIAGQGDHAARGRICAIARLFRSRVRGAAL